MDRNRDPRTKALIARLETHWSASGVTFRPGVSHQQIAEFESQHKVCLPPDLREYFTEVDGMADGFDPEMFTFLPLEAVRRLPDVLGEHGRLSAHHKIMEALPEPHGWFVIVDYLISSAIFAIQLSSSAGRNPVLGYCATHQIVAPSFSDFLEAYLSDPLGLLMKCDSGELWGTGVVEQRVAQTAQGPVEYADVGQGAPILYFHGNGVGNDGVLMLEKSLLDDGFRLIVPNRPGYYGTPLSCGRSPDDCADLAAALLDHLHIARAVVIGTSGGGPSACRFAARHPQQTLALVMQCALSHPYDSGKWLPGGRGFLLPLFRHLWLFRPLLRLGNRQQARRPDFVSECMSRDRYAELRDSHALKSLGTHLSAAMLRCCAQSTGIENDWATWTGGPWLTPNAVTCPTLILHDRTDTAAPIAHAEWTRQCIPQAEFCELHAGGHLIWVGRDQETMRRRRADFIRRHAAAPS